MVSRKSIFDPTHPKSNHYKLSSNASASRETSSIAQCHTYTRSQGELACAGPEWGDLQLVSRSVWPCPAPPKIKPATAICQSLLVAGFHALLCLYYMVGIGLESPAQRKSAPHSPSYCHLSPCLPSSPLAMPLKGNSCKWTVSA